MKHNLFITLCLLILFLTAHIIGLFIIQKYLPTENKLPFGIEKPQFDEKTSYLPIFLTIIIGTILSLILIRFKAVTLFKSWYFLSVLITLVISFSAFIPEKIAFVLALLLAGIKIIKPNMILHNLTEVFIYGGIAAIFVPVIGISSIIILLVLISIYDMIAVWKTKHMISLATFQAKSKIFAGLSIPYTLKSPMQETSKMQSTRKSKPEKSSSISQAILGGGDIAFPLIFSGVMLKNFGFIAALLTSLTAALALFMLFMVAEKKKFYPAMPFITLGSLVGYGLVLLLF